MSIGLFVRLPILVALGVPVFEAIQLPWRVRLSIIRCVSVLRSFFLSRLGCLLPQVGNGVGQEVEREYPSRPAVFDDLIARMPNSVGARLDQAESLRTCWYHLFECCQSFGWKSRACIP